MNLCVEYISNEWKQNWKMSTCNRLDLKPLGSWPTSRVKQPIHWFFRGKGLGIQQGKSGCVGSSKSILTDYIRSKTSRTLVPTKLQVWSVHMHFNEGLEKFYTLLKFFFFKLQHFTKKKKKKHFILTISQTSQPWRTFI